jgi:hypothetical protein
MQAMNTPSPLASPSTCPTAHSIVYPIRSCTALAQRLALLFALIIIACSAIAQAAPRIGVATMQPGTIFFERFGHNSIVVVDPTQPTPLSYNFGFFDMGEDDFIARFVRGEMMYRLVELPWNDDLQHYRESGRGVRIQWLTLTDTEAEALAAALAENARPENARYRYDYFLDNCATRVRDAIDRAIGGAVKTQLTARSQGNTFRSEAVRLASPAPWMWLGFDVGLGPATDRPLSRWEDAYVPMRLADSLREVRRADGRRLVSKEETILPHRIAPEPLEFRPIWWRWLIAGLAIAGLWSSLRQRLPRLTTGLAMAFWGVGGLLGALMLFIWLGTEHRFAWANHNLLLLNPLGLLLLPGAWRAFRRHDVHRGDVRRHDPGQIFRVLLAIIGLCAIAAMFLYWVSAVPQANAHWISLLLPIHVALVFAWWRVAGKDDASNQSMT